MPTPPEGKECNTTMACLNSYSYYITVENKVQLCYYETRGKDKMAVKQEEYENIRDKVIAKFKILYKDALAMDLCEVPKDIRIRLLEDPIYQAKTKAARANLFAQQLETLDAVLAGSYCNTDKPVDTSGTILKALEMKNKLLLEDLNVTKDDSNALNVTFVAMKREDFEALETVEINEGGNSVELGVDFGTSDDTDSFEARLKKDVKERMKQVEAKDNG